MARTRRDTLRKKKENVVKDERVMLVESLIAYGVQGMEDAGVIRDYNRGIKYLKGDHEIRVRDKTKGNKVYNKFAEIINTRLSHLTDAKPKWLFRPQGEEDRIVAHILNQIVGDVIWDYIEWDKGEDGGGKGEDSVLQAVFAGSSHIKTYYDEHNGYPNFAVIPCGSIIVDRAAKSKKQLRYWIHLTKVSVAHIKRRYGVDVQPQEDLDRLKNQDRADFHRPQITGQLDTTNDKFPSVPFKFGKDGDSPFGGDPLGQAIIAECWMEDHQVERIPYEDSETEGEHSKLQVGQFVSPKYYENHPKHIEAHTKFMNSLDPETESNIILAVQQHIQEHELFPQTQTQKKYPFGRVITICQGKVLLDRANPLGERILKDGRRLRIGLDFRDVLIKWDYNKNPESYWGIPLTNDLFDPQDDLNHRKNSITQNINLLNTGIRKIKWQLYDKLGIKKNPGRLNNMPGNVIPFINTPDEFTTDFGTPFPSQVWGDINWTERFMETQSLHQDAAAGRLPAAGTANVTLETLLSEFKTILRKPLRHYAGALAEMGRNAVLIMNAYMPASEKFLILGEDQQTYAMVQWGDIKDRAALMRNVRIDTANMLPTSRLETFRKVIEMMQSGVPPEAAIQLLDDPKAIQVMQTMSVINKLAAENEELKQILQQAQQEINTMRNRMQGDEGMGNVGIFNTG